MSVLLPKNGCMPQSGPSRLRKNSLVLRVKPVESTIFAGVSEIPQHGQIACPDRSKCDFRASWMLFKTSMSTLRKRLKNVFPQPARQSPQGIEAFLGGIIKRCCLRAVSLALLKACPIWRIFLVNAAISRGPK